MKQAIFNQTWKRDQNIQAPEKEEEFSPMRAWQIEAFDDLKGSPLMIVNAPMGSGKSWLMCLLSAFKMKQDAFLRCVIVVPQTIIATGFLKAKLKLPNGEEIDWRVGHNLCEEEQTKSTVRALIRWLERPHSSFSDRIVLCTHSTLLRVYRKLQLEGRLELLENLLLWIDEAHHLMNASSENLSEMVDSNGMGELVQYLLGQMTRNIQIGLTTASFFRGDRRGLLTEEMQQKFKRYDLPYDRHLASMKYLESFSFEFVMSGYDYMTAMDLLLKQKKRKDIIYIPHTNSYSIQSKHQQVDSIVGKYKALYGKGGMRKADGVVILEDEGEREFRIVDLVDDHPQRRAEGKNYIRNPVLNKNPDALDAIITMNMFKEGANWVWADRAIIVGTRSSLVDIVQMVGRLLRDAKGKKHAEVIQLLPFSLDQSNGSVFRENLNDYLKAVYASLIIENIFDPVKIKAPSSPRREKEEREEENSIQALEQDWLGFVIPDASKQHELIERVGNQLMAIKADRKEPMTAAEHQQMVAEILKSNGIHEHKEEIAKQILGLFFRKTQRLQGISVKSIDFDILKIGEPLEFLLKYTSGVCNIDTFKQLRDAIAQSRQWRPFEEAREWIRKLGIKGDTEWRAYVAGQLPQLPPLPPDIPKAPWAAYEGKGWVNLGDYLGTNMTAPRLRKYRSYEGACEFARSLQLKRKDDWPLYTQGQFPHLPSLPSDIAVCPDKTYRRKDYGQKWTGWGDFLGTGVVSNRNKSKTYLSYQEAKDFVQPLGLQTSTDWKKYIAGEISKLPAFPAGMPKKPDQIYENFEWWDFFGAPISKMNCRRPFWAFEKAREFVSKLGLKNFEDWIDYCAGKLSHLPSKPIEIPSNPQKKYKDLGWQGYAHWMGY